MTVLTTQTPLVGTGAARLPRVNLLPPEIAEQRAFRRIQLMLGAAGVAALATVGLLYVSASHSVSSAQSDLAAAKQQNASLVADVAKYKDVTATINAAQAAQAQLASAMADEIRYSQMMTDLSLTIPSNVWLKSLSYGPAVGGTAGTVAVGATGGLPVGTLNVTGVAFSHDDVATWLEAIAGLKTYANPYFSNSTESLIGPRKVVTFSSTAVVTSKALSNRYTNSAGS